jgi:hypothetical protein
MPSLRRLLENSFLTRKIHTKVPSDEVDLEAKVQELFAVYKIKDSTKKELFSLLHKPSINLPQFSFPVEVNSVVYSISGKIHKGHNFDRISIRLKTNRALLFFYWAAFLFMLLCTFWLVQKSAAFYILGLNGFMLLRIVLFFISCNQELNKIKSRMTGFLMKSNRQPARVYLKKRA